MSKHKNVHPDHYKTRGSGHQGEEIVQQRHRERLTRERAELERRHEQESRRREEQEEADASAGSEKDEKAEKDEKSED